MKYHIVILLLSFSIIACKSKKVIQPKDNYAKEIAKHRTEYKEDFIKDSRSPLREPDFKYMHFYPADIAFKCSCDFDRTKDAKPFEMSTVSGNIQIFKKYGIARCTVEKEKFDINIYANLKTQAMPGYSDYLFVPFKDMTSGESTYGGGRYLNLRTGDIVDGKVTLDFNKCYNPWCMYSDGYNCPIPPSENHLTIAIKAGEKKWTGKKKY